MALSADDNTALIGGSNDNGYIGAAWVFTRSGSTWTPPGPKLTGSDVSGIGELGFSLALSADRNTALLDGPADNEQRRGGLDSTPDGFPFWRSAVSSTVSRQEGSS